MITYVICKETWPRSTGDIYTTMFTSTSLNQMRRVVGNGSLHSIKLSRSIHELLSPHKRPGKTTIPIIEETRQYIHDTDRKTETTATAQNFTTKCRSSSESGQSGVATLEFSTRSQVIQLGDIWCNAIGNNKMVSVELWRPVISKVSQDCESQPR